MPKTAPFSSSVAFLTPPTFPAPAPRKRFFDPLPKKFLGFRTRKGRPPRRQYLARARLEFRAGLRVWYLLRPPGWRRWRMAGRPADCRSCPPSCRPSARHAAPVGAAHPDRLPPVEDLPPRPSAAPVCRSAAGQAGAAAEGICRARYRPRIS